MTSFNDWFDAQDEDTKQAVRIMISMLMLAKGYTWQRAAQVARNIIDE